MTICLDMMGGDFAPLEAVKGVRDYLTEADNPALLFLVGDEAQINPLLQQFEIPADKVKVIHAPQVIEYNESPTKALKEKQQSSIAVGFHLLATGKAGAFISAGNTGAMLVGAMYSIKPMEGVQRPTISTLIPKDNGNTGLLLDVGLNADCKPEHLNQFALLGSLYAKHILGIDNPRVALLNMGRKKARATCWRKVPIPC
jgi:glycerol-3-phosphate acyltransferase PlsX